MKRFICIHGHFYQPPRENPYFEEIFRQKETSPFHDWNEKIYYESYLPNSASRVLDETGRILEILNNYNHLSFNFGPTLISWLKKNYPEFITLLRESDLYNIKHFGFGNAIAQPYSHIIMPLAKEIDIRIQTVWGIKSFENTFYRKPSGMWLPETAVDLKTLRILHNEGIKFVILGAHQCEKVKPLDGQWINVNEWSLNINRPYKVFLEKDQYIWVFFFHRPLSGELSFGSMLRNGDLMGEKLIQESLKTETLPSILLLACDGETFGHHHKFGEMALSRAIKKIKESNVAEIAPLEYILRLFENLPAWEATIRENTSWSCAHGLGRWQEDCGCSTGGEPNWHQKWRAPLREAINFLVDKSDELFEDLSEKLFKDPLKTLEEYINLVEGKISQESFLKEYFKNPEKNALLGLKLLELQRMKMFAQTSCGWFFSDISGTETVQILTYASRCIFLYKEISGIDIESSFKEILKRAIGNRPKFHNGEVVYEKLVMPWIYDKEKLLASAGFLSRIRGKNFNMGTLNVNAQVFFFPNIGETSITSGEVQVKDLRTSEKSKSFFIGLKFKDLHQLIFLLDLDPDRIKSINEKLIQLSISSHHKEEILELVKSLKPYATYDLRILPTDYREEILNSDIAKLKERLIDIAERIYKENREIIATLRDMEVEIPPLIKESINIFFENLIRNNFQNHDQPLWTHGYTNMLFSIIEEASSLGTTIKLEALAPNLENRFKELFKLYIDTKEERYLEEIENIINIFWNLKLYLNIWRMQNDTFNALKTLDKEKMSKRLRETLIKLGFSEKLVKKEG
ncbi:MAG: DUF3536 domain-containing protein [Synergistetes bacterium]|nr:DUF3536 domain-containing protein [Synergistota bacterium]MCX8127819.1 DUF3536 domain-containing protein [Synergistota bacterium]MDW8192081.1 DUF3536 domain-containing protein [Synergistota bacterium]